MRLPSVLVVAILLCCVSNQANASDDFDEHVEKLTDATFASWRENHPNALVMFFAPWCGHCKAMKPAFAELAQALADSETVAVAAVDCTENAALCSAHEVSGYPTILHFQSAAGSGKPYQGERTFESMKNYLTGEKKAEEPDTFAEDVPQLTDETFDEWRTRHPKAIVMFFAPWCGHCKAMKPAFAAAAVKLRDSGMELAAVDCTSAGSEVCKRFDVSGYPTVKVFLSESDEGAEYAGGRSEKAIVKYARQQIDPAYEEPFLNEPLWGDDNGNVVHLTDDHWDAYRAKSGAVLAFFYAPWCGHCKATKPEFAAASRRFHRSVVFAAVDCTENQVTCGKYDVHGYPTIRYFTGPADTTGTEYDSGRLEQSFINFVDSKLAKAAREAAAKADLSSDEIEGLNLRTLRQMLKDRGVACAGCVEKADFVAKLKESIHLPKVEASKTKMTWAEEQRMKKAEAAAARGWGEEGQDWEEANGNVKHLSEYSFEEFHKKSSPGLVMFYADWCGHCKRLKPEFVAASRELNGEVTLAAVECDNNPTLCKREGVTGYPTLKYFDSASGELKKFSAMDTKSIVKGMRKITQPNQPAAEFVNEPLWGEDNGAVVHLTDDHFDTYRQTHPRMLVMFYAPWCGHCKAFKPSFAAASTQLAEQGSDVVLAAVDCTEHGEVCNRFEVHGYPTILWFGSAQSLGEKADMSRTTEAVVAFVNARDHEEAPADEEPVAETEFAEGIPARHPSTISEFRTLKENRRVFAMFYSNTAKGFENAKAEFIKVKSEVSADTQLVGFDCGLYAAACKDALGLSADKLPHFRLYSADSKDGEVYSGAHKFYAMLTFLDLHEKGGKDEL